MMIYQNGSVPELANANLINFGKSLYFFYLNLSCQTLHLQDRKITQRPLEYILRYCLIFYYSR